ncbi:MORC family CW-type zinc finger protein 3-like [Trichomycterus rosablanca]|uniref:MORC family CW-type zinc finger protein 3-like n=1 Tax=Trichomycterus rosablanca TaxID=2290929 RepID=UPI002F360753
MAAPRTNGIPISTVNPQYLHTNSTSHKWPFSAIAELIDNGFDVKAKQFWIDKQIVKGQIRLVFMDNGAGMDFNEMHKMLSFGFNDKQRFRNHVPVGRYGNGFKSSSMRLGRDAIVFSRRADTMCVGLLSQTYLEEITAENVIVPIISFTPTGQTFDVEPEHEASLQAILKYSLFNTKEELLTELRLIDEKSPQSTGTRIIIWNLRYRTNSVLELDFSQDLDIRIPDNAYESTIEQMRWQGSSVPESEYSLRAYCSILYLIPKMQIIIRGEKVKTLERVSKGLAHISKDRYKPKFLNHSIEITFGYNTKSKDHYGIMMYHNNRLIKAYEPVACQRKAESTGVGVIGIIECNYLIPTHNKQDFMPTDEYRKTMQILNTKLKEYCGILQTNSAVKDSVSCDAEQEPQDSEEADESRQHLSGVTKRQQQPSSSDSILQTGPAVKSPARYKTLFSPSNMMLRTPKPLHLSNLSRNKRAQNQDNTEAKKPRFDSRTADTSASEACSSKTRNIPDSDDCEAGLQLDDNNSVSSEKSRDQELLFQQDEEEMNQLQHEQEQLKEKVSNQEDDTCTLSSESMESDLYENENLNEGQENNNLQAYKTTLNELSQRVAQVLSKFVPPLNHQKVNNVCQDIDEIFRGVIDEISKAAST